MIDYVHLSLVASTDVRLNRRSVSVRPEAVDSATVQALIDRMSALAAGKGHSKQDSRQMVGLAAPQLGIGQRIIMIDLTADGSRRKQQLQAVINPRITYRSKQTLPGREGCWSCGNICGNVERHAKVTLRGLDRQGKPLVLRLEGFVARVAQHEVDHLAGMRFPDRIPVSAPERLHWVEPAEFNDYRTQWMHWPKRCPRAKWEAMKAGKA